MKMSVDSFTREDFDQVAGAVRKINDDIPVVLCAPTQADEFREKLRDQEIMRGYRVIPYCLVPKNTAYIMAAAHAREILPKDLFEYYYYATHEWMR